MIGGQTKVPQLRKCRAYVGRYGPMEFIGTKYENLDTWNIVESSHLVNTCPQVCDWAFYSNASVSHPLSQHTLITTTLHKHVQDTNTKQDSIENTQNYTRVKLMKHKPYSTSPKFKQECSQLIFLLKIWFMLSVLSRSLSTTQKFKFHSSHLSKCKVFHSKLTTSTQKDIT